MSRAKRKKEYIFVESLISFRILTLVHGKASPECNALFPHFLSYNIDNRCESGYGFSMSVEIKAGEGSILPGYIVFEGLDGAGTTTQALLLAETMKRSGIPVWPTFEPTSGDVGVLIRRILGASIECHPGTLAALFVADRYEHLYGKGGILSRLQKGFKVIGDRYLFSSLAYQSLDVDFEHVYEINSRFPLPGHLIFLDMEPEECERRMNGRESRELFENIEMQRRVRALYERTLELYRDRGMNIHRLDGLLPREDLAEKVWSILSSGR